MGGKFLLRIEDTDKARNTPEAVDAILKGLEWLNLSPDEPPYFQSQRAERHAAVAMELLNSQDAYWDNGAIRIRGIKGPQTLEDLVQGQVTWPQDIDDFVILRSDGTPTYMLSVVVDDYDMGVTHVIRGDDHLNNAFRQMSIYKAMGWTLPQYGHIPLILDERGKKLSKRSGGAVLADYIGDVGILSEAMLNYLARLGWGHGNDELFSMEQAVEWFDIKDVGRNPARMDGKKLNNVNAHWIRQSTPEKLAELVNERLVDQGIELEPRTLLGAMKALQERSQTITDLADGTYFLWCNRPVPIDDKAQARMVDVDILLKYLHSRFEKYAWGREGQEEVIQKAMRVFDLKMGKVVEPLRIALTGSLVSPPIYDVMDLLGKEETLARIKDQF
jgi:glutamyl-tRNA synthetase